jgi:hypothetical protein
LQSSASSRGEVKAVSSDGSTELAEVRTPKGKRFGADRWKGQALGAIPLTAKKEGGSLTRLLFLTVNIF